ncbi:ATP-dependent DNA helicase PIF1-like protein, partial [Tanacetum coccineum]
MRLRDPTLADSDVEQLRLFTNWLLDMGDCRLPAIALDGEDEATWITIPDGINSHVLEKVPGELHELYSADSICQTTNNLEEMQIMYPMEFLNTLHFSGIPNHKLELKVGVPIILLRNLNMQCGDKVLIHRIDMTPTDLSWPFQFRRHQFPIKVCFGMTINKSQGQTFNNVCAFLSKPVFTHGQLYVVASRVTSRSGLRFYIDNGGLCANNLAKNLVYKEEFYNLPRGMLISFIIMTGYYDNISDLSAKHTDMWRINVMVTLMFKPFNPKTNQLLSLDCILVDERRCMIHAKIPVYEISKFENHLQEGRVYQISKFKVLGYGGMLFRPLAREVYVQFSRYTRVVPSYIPLEAFPRFLFEFVEYENLKDRYNDDKYLTDEIGILTEWGPLMKKTRNNASVNSNVRNAVIRDL